MTYYAGIDIGSCYCKCVIIDDNEIKAKSVFPIEGSPKVASKNAIDSVLGELKLKIKNLKNIVGIGRNQKKVPFKIIESSEIKCIAKGAVEFIPSLKTIVDLGALTNKAIKLNSNKKVIDYVINDKCASGSGMFLELVANALEMSINEIGEKAKLSQSPLTITSQCSIFAESEVIYLVNEGKSALDIAAGVSNSIANRVYSLLKKVGMEKDITVTGGVANNQQIISKLEERLGHALKRISIDPIFIAAYGAALFAKEI
ncbi:MAG: acyl-CoA dehydratase activase [Candidatus Helarchaeota archaeon]